MIVLAPTMLYASTKVQEHIENQTVVYVAPQPQVDPIPEVIEIEWGEVQLRAEIEKVFAGIPKARRVAECESTMRHYKEDGSVLQGHIDPDDTGVFQVNKRYHEETAEGLGLDLDLPQDNIRYARWLYDRKGWQPWSASRHCWR